LALLFVGYQLPNVARLHRRNKGSLAQVSFSFLALARKNMTLETFVALDLAATGHTKSLRGGSIGFYLRHF
jgi:hypothetical protein